jgi:hypothetical protein
MSGLCGCADGRDAVQLGCLECGAPCCPACAVHLESVAYCDGCARSLLETSAIRVSGPFDLH